MMKHIIFFLIAVLAIGFLIPDVFAQVEKGKNYDRELIGITPDGLLKYKWTSQPERIYDGSQYQDYIFTDTPNSLMVETMGASVTLDKTTCGFSFHNKGFISENPTPLFTDSILPYSMIVNSYVWNEVTQVSGASCQASWNGSELTATKTAAGIGEMKYKYILTNNKWKTQLEATNLTSLTDRVFGFDQTINLNRDVVFFGGSQRNLDNYHNTTFDRLWLENNQKNLIEFLNGYNYDFELGFEYLDSVTVIDDGTNSSQLVFHFLKNNSPILPGQTLIIDPTFSFTDDDTIQRANTDNQVSADCAATVASVDTSESGVQKAASGNNSNCSAIAYQWDLSSITASFITVSDVDFRIDIDAIGGSAQNCNVNDFPIDLDTATNQQIWDNAIGGTAYVNNDTYCTTTGNQKTLDLGTDADDDLASRFNGGEKSFAVGIYSTSLTRPAASWQINLSDAQLEFTYEVLFPPDAVDDLTSPSQTFGSVDLLWTEPALNGGNVTGYQINYTTPWGNPDTIITNNTGTTTTSATVTGLSLGTDYTFGVSVWTEVSNNATKPPMTWLNITTQGNFTIGSAAFNQTNTQTLPFTFEEQTINATAKFLNVTFSNAFDPAFCDFNYKFANINQTYGINDDSYSVSTTLNETAFTFVNATNEIIDVYCWDDTTGTDGRYLLTQTSFPLLTQIADFRSGEFGTTGQFGIFDFVTLLVVIISMIGLNRVNESVGAVFNIALLGGLAYFGIIELPTIIFGALAIVIVLVITSTRKV